MPQTDGSVLVQRVPELLMALPLANVNRGYPLLWLAHYFKIDYGAMLRAYDSWAEAWIAHRDWAGAPDWDCIHILVEAFRALTTEGVLRHPGYEPTHYYWPH